MQVPVPDELCRHACACFSCSRGLSNTIVAALIEAVKKMVGLLTQNVKHDNEHSAAHCVQPGGQHLEGGHETRHPQLESMRGDVHPAVPEAASTSPSVAGGGLVRQGSMNLPAPEECGVPAEHPDMCILRIRRHHLIEVCSHMETYLCSQLSKGKGGCCIPSPRQVFSSHPASL